MAMERRRELMSRRAAQQRRTRRLRKPPLRIEQILRWADRHHARTGRWPVIKSGEIADAPWETWARVNDALNRGLRTLPKGYSLPSLLAERRGARMHMYEPRLTPQQILIWADAYHRRTGRWPGQASGRVTGASGESWHKLDSALRMGLRGLPGGSSLAELFRVERGVRNKSRTPRLSRANILAWADAWHAQHGRWPGHKSGPIPNSGGETWLSVDKALRAGSRGLRRPSSLSNLLDSSGRARNRLNVPALSEDLILRWSDDHRRRTGRWPTETAGPILAAPRENWANISNCLRVGARGLTGGDTLARLLHRQRGARNVQALPRLTYGQILEWADAHHDWTGCWPTIAAGDVLDAPGEKWPNINAALMTGKRGLPGGMSLARLLATRRGVRNLISLEPLTIERVLSWADRHHRKTGRWPTVNSGRVEGGQGEKWRTIDNALRRGGRGLPAGSSLSRLLVRSRPHARQTRRASPRMNRRD